MLYFKVSSQLFTHRLDHYAQWQYLLQVVLESLTYANDWNSHHFIYFTSSLYLFGKRFTCKIQYPEQCCPIEIMSLFYIFTPNSEDFEKDYDDFGDDFDDYFDYFDDDDDNSDNAWDTPHYQNQKWAILRY